MFSILAMTCPRLRNNSKIGLKGIIITFILLLVRLMYDMRDNNKPVFC